MNVGSSLWAQIAGSYPTHTAPVSCSLSTRLSSPINTALELTRPGQGALPRNANFGANAATEGNGLSELLGLQGNAAGPGTLFVERANGNPQPARRPFDLGTEDPSQVGQRPRRTFRSTVPDAQASGANAPRAASGSGMSAEEKKNYTDRAAKFTEFASKLLKSRFPEAKLASDMMKCVAAGYKAAADGDNRALVAAAASGAAAAASLAVAVAKGLAKKFLPIAAAVSGVAGAREASGKAERARQSHHSRAAELYELQAGVEGLKAFIGAVGVVGGETVVIPLVADLAILGIAEVSKYLAKLAEEEAPDPGLPEDPRVPCTNQRTYPQPARATIGPRRPR